MTHSWVLIEYIFASLHSYFVYSGGIKQTAIPDLSSELFNDSFKYKWIPDSFIDPLYSHVNY